MTATDVMTDWGERHARWAGVRSEIVEVGGTAVHTLRADGPAEGIPHLLVHGLGGSATNWIEVIAGLAEHGPVLAPDLPGFGRTEPPHPRASRIGANVAFLRALLRTVGYERVVVHGNSMGGMLSVLFAHDRPDHVERLVLASPALPSRRRRMHEIDPATLLRFLPFLVPGLGRVALRAMQARVSPEDEWQQSARFLHGDAERLSPELQAIGLENLVEGRDTDWRLPGLVTAGESLLGLLLGGRRLVKAVDEIGAPTLVVWGEADRLIGRAVIDHLGERRPDWALAPLPAVGHVPMAEAPDDYLAAVGDFLA